MIPEPVWAIILIDTITDGSKHFLLSVSMGALVFSLTSFMYYVSSLAWAALTHKQVSTVVDFGMFISCLLVGLSFALASHWLLDYVSLWYVTPLGPSLNLVLP